MAQLTAMDCLNRFVQPAYDTEAFVRDSRQYHSTILSIARAANQSPLLHSVEQTGDVRVPRDHSVADFAARETFGRTPQDSQDVVLRRGKVLSLQQFHERPREKFDSAQQFERHFLFIG